MDTVVRVWLSYCVIQMLPPLRLLARRRANYIVSIVLRRLYWVCALA